MARKKPAAPTVPPDPPDTPEESPEKTRERWQTRIRQAQRLRKDWELRFEVERCERFFIGDQEQGRGGVAFNHFWATIKTTRPSLFYQSPTFFVRPKAGQTSPVSDRLAAMAEAVLQTVAARGQNLKRAGRLAVTQAFFRLGVLKICFDPRFVENPRAGKPIVLSEDGEPVLDELGKPREQQDPLTGQPILEPDQVMTDQVYRWDWVDAANLLLPDDGPDPTRWSWIGEEVTVPLEVAKADSRFPDALRSQLVANVTERERPEAGRRRARLGDGTRTELVRYTEAYDLGHGRWLVVADGQPFEDFLVDDVLPDWIEDHPYAILALGEPIIGPEPSPWPVPFTRPWLDPQSEYNIRRRQITEGAKRSARKVYYDSATFPNEDEAVKSLQSSDDMAAVQITDISKPPVGQTDPPLPQIVLEDIPLLQSDWRLLTGQTGARLSNPDANTATEASYAERGANIRESDELGIVNDWLAVAGSKMLQCLKATLTLDLYVKLRELTDTQLQQYLQRVYGMDPTMLQSLPGLKDILRERFGQAKWVTVTREDLMWEADVTVVPGSMRPKNLDVERQQWLQFLTVLGQAPQLALSRELLKYTGDKFEGIPDRLLDELTALAQKMIAVNANQAGRSQGGTRNGGGAAGQTGQANAASIAPAVTALLGGGGGA